MSGFKLHPHQRDTLDRMIADGRIVRGTSLLAGGPQVGMAAGVANPDPVQEAERFERATGLTVDHIDADGVITFAEPEPAAAESPCACRPGRMCDRSTKCATEVRGLNTDDFSQAPTIDADKSADWNRKAKRVKPGSFAARRMAGEE